MGGKANAYLKQSVSFRKDHLAVLMSKRRISNVLTIPSAIVVYICLAIHILHFGECQQKEVVALCLRLYV